MPDKELKKQQDREHRNIFQRNSKYFTICVYALFEVVIATILIYLVVNWSKTKQMIAEIISILSPFFIGFFIAYVLNPLVKRINLLFQKKSIRDKISDKAKHLLSVLLSYLIGFGIIIVIMIYIVPQFGKSIEDLTSKSTEMYNAIIKFLNDIQKKYPDINLAFVQNKVSEFKPRLIDFGTNIVTNAFPLIFDISMSIVKSVINIILAIVISVYILLDKKLLIRNAKRLMYSILPKKKADYFCSTASKCNTIFSGFIFGKLIDSLIIGFLCFILMTILRLPYAVLLGTFVGITNMIPYFGPFIGAVPGLVIFLLLDPVQAIIFGILVFVLQQFDGLYLGPKILGESTGLKPIWVIFAITVGGAYFGVIGMFLGVPVVAVIAFLLDEFMHRQLKKRNIKNL